MKKKCIRVRVALATVTCNMAMRARSMTRVASKSSRRRLARVAHVCVQVTMPYVRLLCLLRESKVQQHAYLHYQQLVVKRSMFLRTSGECAAVFGCGRCRRCLDVTNLMLTSSSKRISVCINVVVVCKQQLV